MSSLVLFLLSAAALAAGSISIDASSAPYSSRAAVNSVNYTSDIDIVTAGMTQAVGMYRTINGVTTAPVNTSVTVTWTDKSKSTGKVVSTTSSVGVAPSGNPTPPPSSGGGGSGDPGSGGGGGTGGGSPPVGDCIGKCTGKVIVGPPKEV